MKFPTLVAGSPAPGPFFFGLYLLELLFRIDMAREELAQLR